MKPNGKGRNGGKEIGMVMLLGCRCRCGHEWLPRGDERPRACPRRKSPRWDKPKKFTREKGKG